MSDSIQKIKRVPLRELWRKEDKDFTKWLEEHIDFLNDAIGFDISIESREEKVGPFKVDLYGEDNFGNKVIIENQLEKTDHNHLGQLITYLTNLGANIAIWICKEPTEEHTKAIDWLNEVSPDDISFYLIKLEAIRIGDESPAGPLFTVIKRPTTEKKQIGLEKKEYAQRHVFREKFWTQFLTEISKKNSLFANISPSTDNWIGIGMGRGGFNLNLVISKKYARAEIYINRGEMEENKKAFDSLFNLKEEIEKEFGDKLTWERMEDNVTSRIKHQLDGVNITNEEDWPKVNEFMIDAAERMHRAFKDPIRKMKV
ncbi:MAG: DUF4268 domain-containing protein [Candidatus Colwellbacteria bacterium]|nr:DUF4268 domain-containing protein [Candidatus Colwellbacteria bacterium]